MPSPAIPIASLLLGCLCLAQACGDGASPMDSTAERTIRIERATYAAMPEFGLDSIGTLCPLTRWRCPPEELLLAARASDGDVALATRSGSVYFVPRSQLRIEQILFDRNAGRRTGFGGSLEPVGDSAWRLLLPDNITRGTFSDAGRVLHAVTAPFRTGFGGSAGRDLLFVRLLRPGAERLGDTVWATFEAVEPPSVRGDVIARLPLAATYRKGSDLTPLPPFFDAPPVWGLTLDLRVFYSSATSYEILVLDGDRITIRLTADVPRRPVDPAEIDAAAANFMAMMPSNARFREAAQLDVDRRRDASAAFHPVITDIRFTPSGDIFVRGDVDPDAGTVRWDLFTASFAPRGYFTLDDFDRLLLIQGDSLLVARPMPGGSQTVQWTRLRSPR